MDRSLDLPNAPPPSRKAVLLIFLVCLGVYHANGRVHGAVDTIAAPYTAWSLVRHGSLDLRAYADLQPYVGTEVRVLADGHWVSVRPLGSALAAVPFVAPFALLSEQPLRSKNMNHLGKLASAVAVAGAAVFFFLTCRRLAPTAAWPATVLFALGTCLWSVASQALWMHGPATCGLCGALFLLVRAEAGLGARRGAWSGMALGMAVLTRPTTAIFVLATAAALVWQRRWRAFGGLIIGAALPIGLYCWINFSLFGDVIRGGYKDHDTWAMPTPLWLGLTGLLAAPSRGLLVYSPALVFAPLGVWVLCRWRTVESRPWPGRLLLTWLAAAAATLAFYAKWHDWAGGWCYGPRFLCEIMPIGCMLFALAYASLRPAWIRTAAVLLIGVSVAVQFVGITGHSAEDEWCARHDRHDQGRCLFSVHDTQIEAYARAMLRKTTHR